MKRILWLSRHALLPVQLSALRRLWPGCIVDTHRFRAASFDDGAEVLRLVAAGQYDEVAIVAPLSYVQRLVDAGLRPLWAEMVPAGDGPADLVLPGDRRLRFAGWRRVVGLRLLLEEI